MQRPYSGNNFCPCGSNLKYKKCCQLKGIEYFVKPSGKLVRKMPLSSERKALFDDEKRQFVDTHGRNPTEEEERIMRASHYDGVERVIQDELVKLGASPERIYAFEKTGILVTEENEHQIPPEELKKWDEAIKEFRRSQAVTKQ